MFEAVDQRFENVLRQVEQLVAKMDHYPVAMTREQARRYTGLPASTFNHLLRTGILVPLLPPGSRRRLFRRVDLDTAMQRLWERGDPRQDMDFGED